jgi:hypothetical protein
MAKSVKKTTPKSSALEKKKQQTKVKPTAPKKAATATPKKANKANKAKLEEGVNGEIEYEELGKINDWDWTETSGIDAFISDDAGGFLCLEEISDVEVEYEGDETAGKVAKFKVLLLSFGWKLIFFLFPY